MSQKNEIGDVDLHLTCAFMLLVVDILQPHVT